MPWIAFFNNYSNSNVTTVNSFFFYRDYFSYLVLIPFCPLLADRGSVFIYNGKAYAPKMPWSNNSLVSYFVYLIWLLDWSASSVSPTFKLFWNYYFLKIISVFFCRLLEDIQITESDSELRDQSSPSRDVHEIGNMYLQYHISKASISFSVLNFIIHVNYKFFAIQRSFQSCLVSLWAPTTLNTSSRISELVLILMWSKISVILQWLWIVDCHNFCFFDSSISKKFSNMLIPQNHLKLEVRNTMNYLRTIQIKKQNIVLSEAMNFVSRIITKLPMVDT